MDFQKLCICSSICRMLHADG